MQRRSYPLPGAIILGTLNKEAGYAFPVRVGEPYDLGFLETGGGWGLEEEARDGVAHFIVNL